MGEGYRRVFLIFEVIISLIVVNILFLLGSIFSGLFLFPVLLVSTMNYIRRFYVYEEYDGIMVTFVRFVRGKIWYSFTVLFPLVVLSIFLLATLLVFNEILIDSFPVFVIYVIHGVQLFALYQLIGIMLHSAIWISKTQQYSIKEVYVHGFLVFNLHPIRSLFSMISLIVISILLLVYIDFTYLLFLPVGLFGFYIVNSTIEEVR